MVCHPLLQWTTFCQTSPLWPSRLGWPHMAWLSFIELDKAVVYVIRFTSFLWLCFQCFCPLMPSRNTYHLTWVSLTLDVGYLFTAVPAKRSRCSLPWMKCISSPPPLLTLNVEQPHVQGAAVVRAQEGWEELLHILNVLAPTISYNWISIPSYHRGYKAEAFW